MVGGPVPRLLALVLWAWDWSLPTRQARVLGGWPNMVLSRSGPAPHPWGGHSHCCFSYPIRALFIHCLALSLVNFWLGNSAWYRNALWSCGAWPSTADKIDGRSQRPSVQQTVKICTGTLLTQARPKCYKSHIHILQITHGYVTLMWISDLYEGCSLWSSFLKRMSALDFHMNC